METHDTQGLFMIIIWTLIARVKELTESPIVPIHPRADLVTDLFLRPVISRSIRRQEAEDARLRNRIFRYSSPHPCASSCAVFPYRT